MLRTRRWMQVALSLPLSHHDLLIGQLAALGFTGFQQEESSLHAFLPSTSWKTTTRRQLKNLLDRFGREFPELRLDFRARKFHERNWNFLWERSTGIVEATKSIIIKPSWKKLRKKDKGKIVLHIDPKMSFGTGHHASTHLCLELLEDFLRPGMRVLDFGTGSGILAIAAHKLGASRVVAIDNDEWSISNARENLKRNNIKSVLLLRTDKLAGSLPLFDLIVANIDFLTITQNFRSFLRHLKPGGLLLVSGLLQADLPVFIQRVQKEHALPIALLGEDEWAALALQKSDARRSN
jgi:ribosomal protein L11 methyltransferase